MIDVIASFVHFVALVWPISDFLACIANGGSHSPKSGRKRRVHARTCTHAVRRSIAGHDAIIRDRFDPFLTNL